MESTTGTATPIVAPSPSVATLTLFFDMRNGHNRFNVAVPATGTLGDALAIAVTEGKLAANVVPGLLLIIRHTRKETQPTALVSAIGNNATIEYVVRLPVVENADVALLLRIRLHRYIAHPPPNRFIFISIASAIIRDGENPLENAHTQQCPRGVIDQCLKAGLQLTIILIDEGFTGATLGKQIFGLDGQWYPSGLLLGGEIMHYTHSQSGAQLSTYPTQLANWSVTGALAGGTVAGVSLADLGHAVRSVGSRLLVQSYDGANVYARV